jgi:hypothetical protein
VGQFPEEKLRAPETANDSGLLQERNMTIYKLVTYAVTKKLYSKTLSE